MNNAQAGRPPVEEIANAITHGLGLGLSLVGLGVLISLALVNGDGWQIVGCTVFGVSLVTLYAASTLYHSVASAKAKKALRVVDHGAIYLLIAGTYTPFTLVKLRGPWGWTLFGVVWGLALCGFLFKVLFIDRFRMASVLLYLVMGWMCLIAIKPLMTLVPGRGILWLVAGGFSYTIGVGFYSWKRLPYSHAIWHLFVLGGSVCHYFAVVFYVLLAA
jgi:hemolysin III